MSFICLWSPSAIPTVALPAGVEDIGGGSELLEQLVSSLLRVAPRVVIGAKGVVWADARGMSAEPLARDLVAVYRDKGVEKVRAAISIVPISAE
ncbi:MAG: hypothetical protein ACJ79X_11125, partial [Gemmatimonadaceae bacterium]